MTAPFYEPWLRDEGWEYYLEPESDAHSVPVYFQSIIKLWASKADGAVRAAWRDFDFMDFSDWWGWISVFDEVPGESAAFDVRLWGSAVTKIAHFDLSGKRVEGAAKAPDGIGLFVTDSDIAFMREVLDRDLVGYCHGPVDLEFHVYGHYSMIALPLSANRDGNRSVMTAARSENISDKGRPG